MKKAVGTVMVLAFMMAGLVGCASGPTLRVFQADYPKTPVYVMDLSFDEFPRPEKWESQEEWNKHIVAWQKKFKDALLSRYKEAKYIESTEGVKDGIVIQPYVSDMIRKYNHYFGGADYMHYDIKFIKGTNQERAAILNIISDSSGAGFTVYTFGGRMGACAVQGGVELGKYLKKHHQ